MISPREPRSGRVFGGDAIIGQVRLVNLLVPETS